MACLRLPPYTTHTADVDKQTVFCEDEFEEADDEQVPPPPPETLSAYEKKGEKSATHGRLLMVKKYSRKRRKVR